MTYLVQSVPCLTCKASAGERCRTRKTGRVTDFHSIRYEMAYPPPGAHACLERDPNCWRCDLNADEMEDQ